MFAGIQRLLPVVVLAMPNARFQPVFVEDVAAVFVESLTRLDTFGRSYELGGPKVYTLREIVQYVGEQTGHTRPIIGLGPQLSNLLGLVMGLSPVKLLTRDNVASMKLDSVTTSPLPFGIEPTALEGVAPAWLARRTPRERYNRFRDRATRQAASDEAIARPPR
jgi:NADH dehydrogenase